MSYIYETLGDERFQKLCQAILATVHPNVQCLPVGQPDGGRDAVLRGSIRNSRTEQTVFQVKYSRTPSAKSERDVIDELIRGEKEKVRRLVDKGLREYYLLTNVGGTSHPDVGSIDRVNEALTAAFGIDAYCWWRDDLDARIDSNSSIKWSYPEILRGSDFLQAMYENKFGPEQDRRLTAIRAYLAYQYKYDSQLKFKQVDLSKNIVDLFVDVPATAVPPAEPKELKEWIGRFNVSEKLSVLASTNSRAALKRRQERIGAVEALSDPLIARVLPKVVIEGAPGQGKSTVTQFLCQLHRMILLRRGFDATHIPSKLRPTDVRLPMRVDLRDYATWLNGQSPFRDQNSPGPQEALNPGLESFLSAQIATQSGGSRFETDDLLAIAQTSSILIVLDGFDEVADISTRNRLVKEISDAAARFEGNALSYQLIVTSRPAAFANSPGFPRDEWQHIQILPLTREAIFEYTTRWVAGHNLEPHEARDIDAVLTEKLEHSHVQDLARNPMQLAILLALILTQGASLPDKRTALYDRYIEIFFNRESEKSRVVRDKRDILIAIHRHLAWVLQVEAETNAKAGHIEERRLREILRTYLSDIGHDPADIEPIFAGMVERVVALVSRIQGTFEFEVQPLREYFAARYLYDTAPHIPVGSQKSGSIMDRFDALARNSYWLNVTRFYCGCYSSGELPSLVDGLITIGESNHYEGTNYISELSFILLSDYVFSQQPKSVTRLCNFLLDDSRFNLLLARLYEDAHSDMLQLPEKSGREAIREKALHTLTSDDYSDRTYAAAGLLRANTSSVELYAMWPTLKAAVPKSRQAHLANQLDIYDQFNEFELADITRGDMKQTIRYLHYNYKFDFLNTKSEYWLEILIQSLDCKLSPVNYQIFHDRIIHKNEKAVIEIVALTAALAGLKGGDAKRKNTFHDSVRNQLRMPPRLHRSNEIPAEQFFDASNDVVPDKVLNSARTLSAQDVEPSLDTGVLINDYLTELTNCISARSLVVDAAITSYAWLTESGISLPNEGVFAILTRIKTNADNLEWWLEFLVSTEASESSVLVAKCYLHWASPDVVSKTVQEFSRFVDNMNSEVFSSIYTTLTPFGSMYPTPSREPIEIPFHLDSLQPASPRYGATLCHKVSASSLLPIVTDILSQYTGSDRDVLNALASSSLRLANRIDDFWPKALGYISSAYIRDPGLILYNVDSIENGMPLLDAKTVCAHSQLYPLSVVHRAERVLQSQLGPDALQVGTLAAHEDWFANG